MPVGPAGIVLSTLVQYSVRAAGPCESPENTVRSIVKKLSGSFPGQGKRHQAVEYIYS